MLKCEGVEVDIKRFHRRCAKEGLIARTQQRPERLTDNPPSRAGGAQH
jgi:ribosomal protein S21